MREVEAPVRAREWWTRREHLWRVRHLHRDPIDAVIPVRVRGDARDADTQVRVREVRRSPGTAPCIRVAAERVRRFRCREVRGYLARRPARPAVPGDLDAYPWCSDHAVGERVESYLNAANARPCGDTESIVVEEVAILSCVVTGNICVCTAVRILSESSAISTGVRGVQLVAVVVSAAYGDSGIGRASEVSRLRGDESRYLRAIDALPILHVAP